MTTISRESLADHESWLEGLASMRSHVEHELDKGESFLLRLATDSEYKQRVNGNNLFITYNLQRWDMDGDHEYIQVEHPDFRRQRPLRKGEVYPQAIIGTPFFLDLLLPKGQQVEINVDLKPIKDDPRPVLTAEVGHYFAPGDPLCLFPKSIRRAITSQLEQNGAIANIEGKPIYLGTITIGETEWIVALKVLDIAKEGPPGGLKKLAAGVGHEMPAKDLMDEYKTDMTIPYLDPSLNHNYNKYCNSDATVIPLIHRCHQDRFPALGNAIKLSNTKPSREYRSMGSMVSELNIRKLEDHCRLEDGSYPWHQFTKRQGKKTDIPWELKDLLKFASVKYLAGKTSSQKAMLAIVNGGLAKHMKPTQLSLKGMVPDWDVSGAYASCQKNIDYCIGIPHTYGLHENSKAKPLTIKRFMSDKGSELLPRKWVLSVSGTLNHRQTLVPSKIVTQLQLNTYREEGASHVPGDFTLMGSEVINGIITSDIWDILTKVCNRLELASWENLTVNAAAWYPASHQCHSPEEWKKRISESSNTVEETTNKKGHTCVTDTRSKAWFYMPLADIITPWSEERARFNKLKKTADNLADKTKYDGLQSAMKLGNNTNYGVQASPLFPIGNVVTANNITALCRSAVWTSVMAANGTQVITDGFCYEANNVRNVNPTGDKNRYGMNTLCTEMLDPDYLGKNEKGQFTYGPLGGVVWSELEHSQYNGNGEEEVSYKHGDETIKAYEEKHILLDDLFTEHVKRFWSDLVGSELSCFDILTSAHKHVYREAYFHSQTNYSFVTADDKQKVKARGHQLSKEHRDLVDDELTTSPYKKFITDLASNPKAVPLPKPCTIPTVLKVNAYNNMGARSNMALYWDIDAGDSIEKSVFIRPISLSPFLFKTWAQHEAWFKRNDRLKQTTGWGLEQYFLNPDGTLDYERAVNTIHKRIMEGENWVISAKANDRKEEHPYLKATQRPDRCAIR